MSPEKNAGIYSANTTSLKSSVGSGRAIFYPAGLQGADEMIPAAAKFAGLSAKEYDGKALVSDQKSEGGGLLSGSLFRKILEESPVLFLVPTSFQLKGRVLEESRGKVGIYATVSTGTDHADLSGLESCGISYVHAPGANARSVVEYDLAVLVELFGSTRVLSGDLEAGIVGYGRIGTQLGKLFESLGIACSYYDPYVLHEKNKVQELSGTFRSQVLFFHASLSKGGLHPSFEMIGEEEVQAISPETVIVQAARGELFTTGAALGLAKKNRVVYDVFPVEPPARGLIESARYVTPHTAGYNYDARAGGLQLALRNFYQLISLDPSLIPRWSEPAYDHYVADYLPGESLRLKRDPDSFSQRRSHYPPRGSLISWVKGGFCKDTNYRKLIEILDESFDGPA